MTHKVAAVCNTAATMNAYLPSFSLLFCRLGEDIFRSDSHHEGRVSGEKEELLNYFIGDQIARRIFLTV
jgi:hypothetical protein